MLVHPASATSFPPFFSPLEKPGNKVIVFQFVVPLLKSTASYNNCYIFLYFRQGNGHERDFINNPNVYIMDVYNFGIYPRDTFAKSK